MTTIRAALIALAILVSAAVAAGQPDVTPESATFKDVMGDTPSLQTQYAQLRHAFIRLPVAVAFASILALRPRRRGTPRRQTSVVQTQIILAIVGAVVMLVVGSSLARAFGIVGAAGLVRYRAKIDDPKDAGVMLSTLAVGLASGVGLLMLGAFATVFILAVLWIVESFEPTPTQLFTLKIKTKDPAKLKGKVDELLAKYHAPHQLRTTSNEELHYEVRWPVDRKTDRVSETILKLDPHAETAVEWDDKKEKK